MLTLARLLSCYAVNGIEQWLTDENQMQPSVMMTDEYDDEPAFQRNELNELLGTELFSPVCKVRKLSALGSGDCRVFLHKEYLCKSNPKTRRCCHVEMKVDYCNKVIQKMFKHDSLFMQNSLQEEMETMTSESAAFGNTVLASSRDEQAKKEFLRDVNSFFRKAQDRLGRIEKDFMKDLDSVGKEVMQDLHSLEDEALKSGLKNVRTLKKIITDSQHHYPDEWKKATPKDREHFKVALKYLNIAEKKLVQEIRQEEHEAFYF